MNDIFADLAFVVLTIALVITGAAWWVTAGYTRHKYHVPEDPSHNLWGYVCVISLFVALMTIVFLA